MKIKHFKGIKPGFPQIPLPYFKKEMVLYFIPTPESTYKQTAATYKGKPINPNVEQADWLKAGGMTLGSFFNSRKASAMLGWRYYNNEFHYTPYCHDSTGEIHRYDRPNPNNDAPNGYITGKIYQPIKMIITWNTNQVNIVLINMVTGDTTSMTLELLKKVPSINRTIISWFGGTLPAPQKTTYHKFINVKEYKIWEKIKKFNWINVTLFPDDKKLI